MRSALFLLAISCTVLASCTPINKKPATVSESLNVKSQLESAANSVQQSLRMLAASKKPDPLNAINTTPLTTAEGGMGQRISLDWTGPIEPLLYRLADMTQYDVKVLGPSPAIPIIVTMTVQERQVADLVKDAGLQAGKRATIVVYPSSKIIELRYRTA